MPLLSRLTFPETVGDMLQAADARYAEGVTLINAGHRDGGIYVLGYVAEMVLKVSFCRMDPTTSPSASVRDRFGVAVQHWRSLFNTAPPAGYEHSLLFWETVLPRERAARLRPALGVMVTQTLSECIRIVGDNWDVKMRYQPRRATAREAEDVHLAVQWIYDNRRSLWS